MTTGLVGWWVNSGIGELNRQILEYGHIARFLIPPHPSKGIKQYPHNVDCLSIPLSGDVTEFVKSVDTILFVETPFYPNLVELCQKYNKRVICVPMAEWIPSRSDWTKDVDLFICPNHYSYEELSEFLPCVHFPWPVDTKRFLPRIRHTCRRFTFINGGGGYKGRKGISTIVQALRLWPEMPLITCSQTGVKYPELLFSPTPDLNSDLYYGGDVLLCPHTIDGLGLEPYEAMASGMPSVITDGSPWEEIPAIRRIKSIKSRMQVGRIVDWFTPSAEHLVEICKELLGKSILAESVAGIEWTERQSWINHREEFNNLLAGATVV